MDDLDSLLSEVLEGALSGTSSSAKGSGPPPPPAKNPGNLPALNGHHHLPHRTANDAPTVDELLAESLGMDCAAGSVPPLRPPVLPFAPDSGASQDPPPPDSSRCTYMCLGPSDSQQGPTRSLATKRSCPKQRCTSCDFVVVQVRDGSMWEASADYLFFRNVFPDLGKLRARLKPCPGAAAYCCQCSWVSILPSDGLVVVKRPGVIVLPNDTGAVGRVGGGGWQSWVCEHS